MAYNGWANYETWRVNLEIFDGYDWSEDHYETLGSFADVLKEMADDAITEYGELDDCLAVDYARSFLSDVDWHEIAESIAADYDNLIGEEV